MTTDPFTEAARRDMDPGPTGQNNRAWFVAGAEWQAAQEPTDAEVEDAVTSMKRQAPGDTPDWPAWVWVRFARAALSARRDEEKR